MRKTAVGVILLLLLSGCDGGELFSEELCKAALKTAKNPTAKTYKNLNDKVQDEPYDVVRPTALNDYLNAYADYALDNTSQALLISSTAEIVRICKLSA